MPAMVSVPVREAPALAATANSTVAVPVPDEPRTIVIHASLLAAVHEHPAVVLTVVLSVPPDAGADTPPGDKLKAQAVPSWLTVTVRPATTTVPSREAPVFAATENETVPEPDPLPPAVMATHETLLDAVHEHALVVLTLTDVGPPAAPIVTLAGATA